MDVLIRKIGRAFVVEHVLSSLSLSLLLSLSVFICVCQTVSVFFQCLRAEHRSDLKHFVGIGVSLGGVRGEGIHKRPNGES